MPMREHHSGQLRHESAQAEGERIIGGELKPWRWKEKDQEDRPKNHPIKLALAARLRRECHFDNSGNRLVEAKALEKILPIHKA